MQPKAANSLRLAARPAPPVYCPGAESQKLQQKRQSPVAETVRSVVAPAPPVYRPVKLQIAQPKLSAQAPKTTAFDPASQLGQSPRPAFPQMHAGGGPASQFVVQRARTRDLAQEIREGVEAYEQGDVVDEVDDDPQEAEDAFPNVLYDFNYAAGNEATFGANERDVLNWFGDDLRDHVYNQIVAAGAANIGAAVTYKRGNHDTGGNPVGSLKDIMRVVTVDINDVAASNFDSGRYTYRLRIRARVVFDLHYSRQAGGGNDIGGRTAGGVWVRHMAYNPGNNSPASVVNATANPWGTLAAWQALPAHTTIP